MKLKAIPSNIGSTVSLIGTERAPSASPALPEAARNPLIGRYSVRWLISSQQAGPRVKLWEYYDPLP